MATVRYVIMVPVEVEDEVIGRSPEQITEWGKQLADQYQVVDSIHPTKGENADYRAFVSEAVIVRDDGEDFKIDLDEFVAPNLGAA